MRNFRTVVAGTIAVVVWPVLAFAAGDPQKGNDLFHQNCAACHGDSGKGDGPAAAGLNPKPRDLSDKAYMSSIDDKKIVEIVQKGGAAVGKSPLMPPMGAALSEAQIQDITAYIRTLAK
jgi:mono/diheme cytochrome c family protein